MVQRRVLMSDSGGTSSDLVKIYTARNTLESSLIRNVLAGAGIRVMIPAEEFDDVAGAGLEPEAIFVPVDERDRALRLLKKAWEFYSPDEEERADTDR
jgi:hypothetical protein